MQLIERCLRSRLNNREWCRWSLLSLIWLVGATSYADEATLEVKPTKCVVLEEGQSCHTRAQLQWQVASPGAYCLYNSLGSDALQCWEADTSGHFEEKLVIDSGISYRLTTQGTERVVATAEVSVVWVYKDTGRPTRHWRLF